MYKDGKWARQLIELQDSEGKWGWFHTLSKFTNAPVTTEQALRRLEILGFTMEDECIQRAVSYMDGCLRGRNAIPDRREKLHNWDIFTSLMLSAWIRRFTPDNSAANAVAHDWARVVSAAFSAGQYSQPAYEAAYRDVFGEKPRGGRLVDFVSFYQVSLLSDMLDEKTQLLLVDYLLDKPDGIYYIYGRRLRDLPPAFQSRSASYYLAAVELVARYPGARKKLDFVADWLWKNRNENGMWDMGKTVSDKIWFPLSDNWRKKETREADCTARIQGLLKRLK